ncbi:MAG: phosphotransferase family protein, partial [Thermoanaerobaculia bacterium]
GVPAPRLVDGEHQPLVSPVGAVTLWRRLEIVAGSPSPESIGRLARRLHTSCADDLPVETPDLDPFEPIPGWLDRPGELPLPPGADELWKSLSRLRPRWAEIVGDDPLGTVLVHGDLHADNVVLTPEGPVMLDLEMAGRGPASWDLLPQRLAVQRYGGEPEAYRRFCAGYGDALADSPAVQFLQEVYELHLVSWAVGHRDLSPAMAAEAEIRLAVYLGDSEQSWTLI